MENKRVFVFLILTWAICMATFTYMDYVQKAYAPVATPGTTFAETASTTGTLTSAEPTSLVPGPGEPTAAAVPVAAPVERPKDIPLVQVKTESYVVDFSPAGGVPVQWNITTPDYAIERDGYVLADENKDGSIPLIDEKLEPEGLGRPFEIVLKEMNARFYRELNNLVYTVNRPADTEEFEVIEFESPLTESGLKVVKTYQISKKGFGCQLSIKLMNQGSSRLSFNNEGQGLGLALGPGMGPPPMAGSGVKAGQYSYTQPFYFSDGEIQTSQLSDDDTLQAPVDANLGISLAGLHSRYFMLSVEPVKDSSAGKGFASVSSRLDPDVLATALASEDTHTYYPRVEVYGAPFVLGPGESLDFKYNVFAGPKEGGTLTTANPELSQMLFFGSWQWFRALCFVLLFMLKWFHAIIGNWGWAIILLVITVRLLTFPLAQIGLKHQAKMMAQQIKLKPYLDKVNEKYKDDPTKKSQETMKVYQEHGVNPLGGLKGCMWIVVQMPIFFGLYKILSQAIELRGATFFWIADLSQADHLFDLGFTIPFTSETHFNLLPILTTITQVFLSWVSMKSSPTMGDNPMQKQMMYMMPVVIFFVTYGFPSGLTLYWFISNIWQITQQQFVNKKYLHPQPEKAKGTA